MEHKQACAEHRLANPSTAEDILFHLEQQRGWQHPSAIPHLNFLLNGFLNDRATDTSMGADVDALTGLIRGWSCWPHYAHVEDDEKGR